MNKDILDIERQAKQFQFAEDKILEIIFENHMTSDDKMVKHLLEDLLSHREDLKELIAVSLDGKNMFDDFLKERVLKVQNISKKLGKHEMGENYPYGIFFNYRQIEETLKNWWLKNLGSSQVIYWFEQCANVEEVQGKILDLIHSPSGDIEKSFSDVANQLVGRVGSLAREKGASMKNKMLEVYSFIIDQYTIAVENISFQGSSKLLLRDKRRFEVLFEQLWGIKPLSNESASQVLSEGTIDTSKSIDVRKSRKKEDHPTENVANDINTIIQQKSEGREEFSTQKISVKGLYDFLCDKDVLKNCDFNSFRLCLRFACFSPIWDKDNYIKKNKMKHTINILVQKGVYPTKWRKLIQDELMASGRNDYKIESGRLTDHFKTELDDFLGRYKI